MDGWIDDDMHGGIDGGMGLELQSLLVKLPWSPEVQEGLLGFPDSSKRSLDVAGSNPNPRLSMD